MTATTEARPRFEDVFAMHLDYVWRIVRHLGVPERDADDVTQDVFVVVHRRYPEWEPRADIRSWLYAIAQRVVSDHRDRAWTRRSQLVDAPETGSDADAPDDRLDARRALDRVSRLLESLDEEQRMTFVLYEIEGLAMEEVAQATGCPLKTAYSRLRLARERARAAYERTEGPHGG